MTDDECIALAILHGAKFWCAPFVRVRAASMTKYAIDRGYDEHTADQPQYDSALTWGEAARKYCERHKLLQEVTDECST
jgi:hypothetical protein